LRWFRRIRISISGFVLWLRVGYPFLLFFLAILVVALIQKADWLHIWIILTLGATLTIAEMINYAIERLCDVVSKGRNDNIKAVKDICAGAVLVAGLALAIVGFWVIVI